MAKKSYSIRTPLTREYWDIEIPLQTKDGVGIKAAPIKTIGYYLIGIIIGVFLVVRTFYGAGPIWMTLLFILLWVWGLILLGKVNPTKEMNMQLIPVVMDYTQPNNRKITTRRTQKAVPFWRLVGINNITDDGVIEYSDGRYAMVYEVEGSASMMLFDDDRTAILDRVEAFYGRLSAKIELAFLTLQEPQKVYTQIAGLERRNQKLMKQYGEKYDPDLKSLLFEHLDVMQNLVGGNYVSTHQYMFLMATDQQKLREGVSIIDDEVANSSYMFKSCVMLGKDDIVNLLSSVYRVKKVG